MLELAGHVTISGATLTRVVDKLVSKALVYRALSPVDRRQIRVRLAPLGHQVHDEVRPRVAELGLDVATALTSSQDHETSAHEMLRMLHSRPSRKHPSTP